LKKLASCILLAILGIVFLSAFSNKVYAGNDGWTEYESYTGTTTSWVGMAPEVGQTFTVSSSSHFVTSIYVELYYANYPSSHTVTVSITTATNNYPTTEILASGTINGSLLTATPTWYQVNISTRTLLVRNTQYALVFADPGDAFPNNAFVPTIFGNGYTGGQLAIGNGTYWDAVGLIAFPFQIWGRSTNATGPFYIRADGSIDPPTAPIATSDNVTYTLADNITSNADGIVVNRSNIIINGNGYTLQGSGNGSGISTPIPSYINNVTVRNTNIEGFQTGVLIGNGSNDPNYTLFENNITANSQCGVESWYWSSNDIIDKNDIIGNGADLYFFNLGGWGTLELINNTVGSLSLTAFSATVFQNDITGGIFLSGLDGIIGGYANLSQNSIRGGITVMGEKTSANIANNSIQGGISVGGMGGSASISGNNIQGSISVGENGGSASISGNNIQGSVIAQSYSSVTISANNITTGYVGTGILLYNPLSAQIFENNICENKIGISIQGSYTYSGRPIYHNNFINNTYQVGNVTVQGVVWDNGYPSGGNYWSDYTGVDQKRGPYQNLTGSDGIGDTPYVINANNTDRYPLMRPYSPLYLFVSISPSSTILPVGQPKVFNSSVFFGTAPYKYQWYLNGSLVSGATNATWTFKSWSIGSYSVYVKITDATSATGTSNESTVTVIPPVWAMNGSVGISGYKLVFKETMDNLLESQAIINYFWSFSVETWNGTQWVPSGMGSGTPVWGDVIPALTTMSLPYYVYTLDPSSVQWNEWLKLNFEFVWTYNGTNYSTNYTAELNVHPGDIAGAASVTFPYFGADGKCNLLDVTPIALNWLRTIPAGTDPTSTLARADINGDGVVNLLDVTYISLNWLKAWTNTPPP
jgi:hypothetical protein